ncbi:uncharacterized protein LOC110431306 isoform X2 [Sorghum bicolor]|uniref:Uncharacterized protein n=1 Tax=Sorghum bicolor TaxID=4558 RepID=A0A194YI70_SORBI|nr:uncharacterized protein LOC110431306 isoform X2 [Sorghum bicolor]KXG19648.1 hypothetical protein SORBI_3010G093800 [Sorghum bicolor]|eukprot:XP_021305965.1 uncharacterized protein LOC110431306 isoform X2 [Sorghum bicolor]
MTIFIYVKRLCSKKGILGITCSTFLRSLFYIVVFHKSLRLTNGSRRKLASRRITNLISTNVESLQASLWAIGNAFWWTGGNSHENTGSCTFFC